MANIDERSSISLFAVLVALPVIIAAAMAIASLAARVDRAEARSIENSQKIEGQMNLLIEIREKVIRIEAQTKHPKEGT